MADTAIEWTDKTWNPTTGCTRVSEGCRNCYAFQLHDMRHAAHKAGKAVAKQYAKPFKELQLFEDRLTAPLSWKKPQRVFVNSMSDLFHKDVPDEFINKVFRVMIEAKRHTFQILTKRPERMAEYVSARWGYDKGDIWKPAGNIWLGTSVENQAAADERIPHLLKVPAVVRFLSCEPLLGPVRLDAVKGVMPDGSRSGSFNSLFRGVHWAIVGGESGPGARPCRTEWVREIVQQCQGCDIPVFVKQLGSRVELAQADAIRLVNSGASLDRRRDAKGGDPDEWPADLKIREFPEVAR